MTTNPIWTDPTTSLDWSATALKRMTWQESVDWCASLGDGWRLPTLKELFSITDHERQGPTVVEPLRHDTVSSYYWSSTRFIDFPHSAWGVYFRDGNVNYFNKDLTSYVRAVREAAP